MNISSLVVAPALGKGPAVRERMEKIGGLEVTHVLDDGRMIVVMERESAKDEAGVFRMILDIDGVAAASLAYHYFEEETREK